MAETQQQTSETVHGSQTGLVDKISGAKTINVVVNRIVKHKQYGKYLNRRTRLAVHDPDGLGKVGDLVEIAPSRRISKNKSWRLVRVIRSGAGETR
jgi:small subunit ribosomal protein S17